MEKGIKGDCIGRRILAGYNSLFLRDMEHCFDLEMFSLGVPWRVCTWFGMRDCQDTASEHWTCTWDSQGLQGSLGIYLSLFLRTFSNEVDNIFEG